MTVSSDGLCSVGHNVGLLSLRKSDGVVCVLGVSRYLDASVDSKSLPNWGLVHEELGAGGPVEAGADESALLGLLEPPNWQFASLRFP
jgi:hypothetical protein